MPRLSQEGWIILLGIIGFINGMLPKDKIFRVRSILFIGVLFYNLILLQFIITRPPVLEVFYKYSLPQTLSFLLLYALSSYFIRNENEKNIEDEVSKRLIKEYQKITPNINSSHFDIIQGKEHLIERELAIRSAKKSLVISSGWVSDYVIDNSFLKNLEELLTNHVQIRLIYGYKDSKGFNSSSKSAIKRLEQLMFKYPNHLKIVTTPNHTKIISVDGEYSICGSFNWLSNNQVRNKEISFKSRDKEVIRDLNNALRNISETNI